MKIITKLLSLTLTTILVFPASAEINKDILQAVANIERTERDTVRDAKRKPGEILSLLGVKAGDKIADLSSGGGYYTDILTRIVGKNGQVIAHNAPYVVNRFANFFLDDNSGWQQKLQSQQWQSNVTPAIAELDNMQYPIGLDGALMILFYHDTVWQGVNREMMNKHLFNSLKPGAFFVVVDHSAEQGSKVRDIESLHRIDKQFVIDEVTKAGFVLATDSNLLSNLKDSRDFNVFRDAQTNRDSTDRFVLKFVKPTNEAH